MKKLLFLLAIAFSINSYSQTSDPLNFGIEIGPSINLLRGERYAERFKPAVRFSIGFSFEVDIHKKFAFKTGLVFGKKGMEETYNEIDSFGFDYGKLSVSHIYNYMTIPLLAKYYIDKKSEYYVQVGFYTGLLLYRGEFIRGTGSDPLTPDYTEYSKSTDFGLSFGGGYSKKLSDKTSMFIELRNDFGLTNSSNLTLEGDVKTRHNSTFFLFGMTHKFRY